MREIPLVNGRGIALVDDEDYERLSQHHWYRHTGGYAICAVRGQPRYMHHWIVPAPVGQTVDHVDGNGLNNQSANLRVCAQRENNRNKARYRNSTSRFKGVSTYRGRAWRAQINLGRGSQHLGCFATEEAAARAYDAAAREHFGEFARLNFPNEHEQAA